MLSIKELKQLLPTCSIENMRNILGSPIKIKKTDSPIFKEEEINVYCYLYELEKCFIKITSKDNISIHSLTLLNRDFSNKIDLTDLIQDTFKLNLNESTVNRYILDLAENHIEINTIKDNSACIQFNLTNPFFLSFGLFVYGNLLPYYGSNDLNDLIDSTIMGVCISELNGNIFYIFDYEISNLS